MIWQYNPLSLPLIIGAVLIMVLALTASRRRDDLSVSLFVIFTLCVSGYMLAYSLELNATNLRTILFSAQLKLTFLSLFPIAWLLTVIAYTGHDRWISFQRIFLLLVFPIVFSFLVWTNHLHNLVWVMTDTQEIGNQVYFSRTYGVMLWAAVIYFYCISLAAILILGTTAIRSPDIYQGQLVPLIIGAAIPIVADMVTTASLGIVPHFLDLAPYGMGIAIIPMAFSFFRYKLFDMLPAVHSQIFENISDAIFVLDDHSRVIEMNPPAAELIGSNREAAIGKMLKDLFPELADTIRGSWLSHTEISIKRDDRERYFDLRISTISNRRGRTTGRIAVMRDISALKQAEESARRYAIELEEQNEQLDAFSHTVAHDLQAPLSLTVGYSDLILGSGDSTDMPSIRQFARRIRQAGLNMSDMIKNLLLLSHIDSAGSVIAPIEMRVLARSAVDRFEFDIQDRGIEVAIDENMPDALGHGPWVEEVFANLVSNAIKYIGKDNPAPRITISAEHRGELIRYQVEDNGVGISPDDQKKLWEKFSRFHSKEASGLGLGLSIVLRIIEKLGGTVGVTSAEGEGSTFWFTLPAARPDSAAAD